MASPQLRPIPFGLEVTNPVLQRPTHLRVITTPPNSLRKSLNCNLFTTNSGLSSLAFSIVVKSAIRQLTIFSIILTSDIFTTQPFMPIFLRMICSNFAPLQISNQLLLCTTRPIRTHPSAAKLSQPMSLVNSILLHLSLIRNLKFHILQVVTLRTF
jgi:hypothetical protein